MDSVSNCASAGKCERPVADVWVGRMLDYVISGRTIIDGSGRPVAGDDIGVRNGQVVAVGTICEFAREVIDADGAWSLQDSSIYIPTTTDRSGGMTHWSRR